MFTLSNGAGVVMDGSFTRPEGHREPWLIHFHGTEGELHLTGRGLTLRRHKEPEVSIPPSDADNDNNLAGDLLQEILGNGGEQLILTTEASLSHTRTALLAQAAAAQGLYSEEISAD